MDVQQVIPVTQSADPESLKEFQMLHSIPVLDLYLKHISFCMWMASTSCITMSSWLWGTTASNLKNKTPSSWRKFSHYNMFKRIYSSCGWLSMRNLFHTGGGGRGLNIPMWKSFKRKKNNALHFIQTRWIQNDGSFQKYSLYYLLT